MLSAGDNRRISYGEIAGFATAPADIAITEEPKDLKSPRGTGPLLGKDVPRVDVAVKVTGAAISESMPGSPAWSTPPCGQRPIRVVV